MRSLSVVVTLAALVTGVWFLRPTTELESSSPVSPSLDTEGAARLLNRQPGFFVPNLGQWGHVASFVHRSGPMTLFLEDRGWVIDLVERPAEPKTSPHDPGHHAIPGDGEADQKIRGAALRMTFEGDRHVPEIVGEKKLPGHHNYFLGNDERRWLTDVPLYASVRYDGLYPGIDLRLREANGVPEYDLLLQPGADLSAVTVCVEGAEGLSIASNGSLVIETTLGPLTQKVPKTWQVGSDGRKRDVVCHFTLLGTDRFGFEAPGWGGDTSLTIDPGLIWSTLLGGNLTDYALAVQTDDSGVVIVGGNTPSTNYPTTAGAYDTTHSGTAPGDYEAFVSCFDPRRVGRAQLVYSTFLGGLGSKDSAQELSVDGSGVVTVGGYTDSSDFPTTKNAYQLASGGGAWDAFVTQLDPNRSGSSQLVYSTYLGGRGGESVVDLLVSAKGVVTVAGSTNSPNYPTTAGAYGTTHSGSYDGFVTRLDLSLVGKAQLVYSSLLGGKGSDAVSALGIDLLGIVTVAGSTNSTDYPTTNGAFDRVYNGSFWDGFVSQLDLTKSGAAQLTYSTYLGGSGIDAIHDLAVDAVGVVTVTGSTESSNFPTTTGALDTTYGGNQDVFVSRLDPRRVKSAQLVYSTYLGGVGNDVAVGLAVDARGVITIGGNSTSLNYPTTVGAYSTRFGGLTDLLVSRLDPSLPRATQMIYSTFLGGTNGEGMTALAVDPSGVATVVGFTIIVPFGYPTTVGAFDRTPNGGIVDAVASRLDMGVALYGDLHEISIKAGGTQRLTVNAGKAHANRLYWIFGSITGTKPGVNLLGVHIPLNPDQYTDVAMGAVNTTVFTKFKGTLNANGLAAASFIVPANLPLPSGFTFHHAYVVYDASGKFYMASNAVPLRMR